MNTTFVERYLQGKAAPDDIDDFVDAWHEGDGQDKALAEYLGLDDEEYALWVARPELLTDIIEARRAGKRLTAAG
jgi:hypothetical protein